MQERFEMEPAGQTGPMSVNLQREIQAVVTLPVTHCINMGVCLGSLIAEVEVRWLVVSEQIGSVSGVSQGKVIWKFGVPFAVSSLTSKNFQREIQATMSLPDMCCIPIGVVVCCGLLIAEEEACLLAMKVQVYSVEEKPGAVCVCKRMVLVVLVSSRIKNLHQESQEFAIHSWRCGLRP